MHDEREWEASAVDGGGDAAGGGGGPGRHDGDQGTVSPRGDQPHAVLRLEEATAECSEQGLRRRRIGQAERAGGATEQRQRPDEVGDRGDHGGEPGAKKRALGLEDYAQLPWELQREVEAVVEQTKARSRWPARRTLDALGVSARSYY